MEIKIEAWICNEADEHLLNLVAQGFYSEAWEFIERITAAFHNGLYVIAGRTLNEEIKRKQHEDKGQV